MTRSRLNMYSISADVLRFSIYQTITSKTTEKMNGSLTSYQSTSDVAKWWAVHLKFGSFIG